MTEMKSSSTSSTKLLVPKSNDSSDNLSQAEKDAMTETRKRLALLRQSDDPGRDIVKIAVKSRYPEAVHERKHTEIWGSFFDLKQQRWGYACCKSLDRESECPFGDRSPKRNKH